MPFEITSFGIITLFIAVTFFFLWPHYLIPLMLFLAPFQAASILNIDLTGYPIGIQPAYFVALIYLARKALSAILVGKVIYLRKIYYIYIPLILFSAYAVLSAFIIPFVAEGSIIVNPPRAGHGANSFFPLVFSATNIAQTFYILLCTVLAISISHDVLRSEKITLSLQRTYLATILTVCLLGLYQVLAWSFNFYFPYEFLYSSNSRSLAGIYQVLGGAKRISSTFAEPSLVAHYLVGAFVYVFELLNQTVKKRGVLIMLLFLIFITVGLTTSSTAYLSFSVVIVYYMISSMKSKKTMSRWIFLIALGVMMLLIIAFAITILDTNNRALTIINDVFKLSLLDKTNSRSFTDRMLANFSSIDILRDSFGFGAGWGSHRASSWLFNLVGNAGLWGSLLFGWFMLNLYKRYSFSQKVPNIKQLSRSLFLVIIFTLLAGTIGVPDFSIISLWIIIGWFVGVAI